MPTLQRCLANVWFRIVGFPIPITGRNDFLWNTLHFVAKDQGVFFLASNANFPREARTFRLFDGTDYESCFLECFHNFEGVLACSQATLSVAPKPFWWCLCGRCRGDSAEVDLSIKKHLRFGIHSNIVQAPNIVQNDDNGGFFRMFEFGSRNPRQFAIFQLTMFHGIAKVIQTKFSFWICANPWVHCENFLKLMGFAVQKNSRIRTLAFSKLQEHE